MKYELSDGQADDLRLRYDVQLEAEEVSKRVAEIYSFLALQRGVDIAKVEAESGLRERFGEHLDGEVATCLGNQIADAIIEAEGLSAALEPRVEGVEGYEPDAEWSFTVEIPVKPRPELSSYGPVECKVPDFEITDELIDSYIRNEVDMKAKYVSDPGATEVHDGSFVLISVDTNKLGMPVGPLHADEAVFQIGSEVLPAIYSEKLKDMRPGDDQVFEFDLSSKNFLGIDVREHMQTHLTLHAILKKDAPELTDAWVRENIAGAHDVASFRQLAADSLKMQGETQRRQMEQSGAVAELAKRLPEFDLPAEYYEYSRAGLLQNMTAAFQKGGISTDDFLRAQGLTMDQFMMQMLVQGRQVLHEGLALEALAAHEGFELTEDDYYEALAQIDPVRMDETRKMLEMNGRSYQLREMAMRIKARKHVLSTAKLTYIKPE